MAYTPTEWACGDTVTEEKLNAMERGIADMNAEYVPNTWACGDVITADKLNHMEQGIANGGGGSSDFSTAEVTVAYSPASSGGGASPGLKVYGLINIDDEVGVQCDPVTIPDNSSKNLIVPLYKGKTSLSLSSEPEDVNWDIEGAYSFDDETGNTIITGDCAITIS